MGEVAYIVSESLLDQLASRVEQRLDAKVDAIASHLVERPITSEKAAIFCGVKQGTLYEWMKDPNFPKCKVGGTWLFFPSELAKYIKDHKQ